MKMTTERAQELLTPLVDGTTNGISAAWASRTIEALERVIELEEENMTMYGAIFEASNIGTSAATRCLLELQRIARKDVDITHQLPSADAWSFTQQEPKPGA